MKSTIAFAAVLARMASAQDFNFAAVLAATSPSLTAPPLSANTNSTSIYSLATSSVAASISSAVVTGQATASVTGASASAASTQSPNITAAAANKRGLLIDALDIFGNNKKTTSLSSTVKTTLVTSVKSSSAAASSSAVSSSAASSSAKSSSVSSSTSSAAQVPTTLSATSTTVQSSGTTTTSSDTSCPTQPEAGTYCGFINPEDDCAVQPDGYGPKVTPDTVAAFQAYPEFQQNALTAPTPSQYARVFQNLNASTSANSYLGFYTLHSYDTALCAQHCDNTTLCTAFNLYIERDPSLNPTYNDTDPTYNCPNPASITNYKCSLWGSSIDASSATNAGDWRDDFQVVIVASNGYDKSNTTAPAPVPAFTAPQNCSAGGAISAGGNYWMASTFFPGPFDPSVCGLYAQAQTAKNRQLAIAAGARSYVPCNMFNAYAVHKNGVPQGTYCSLFDTVLTPDWAAFKGAWSGRDFFGVRSSWTYSLTVQDSGKC